MINTTVSTKTLGEATQELRVEEGEDHHNAHKAKKYKATIWKTAPGEATQGPRVEYGKELSFSHVTLSLATVLNR